jgi:hypothetical protein
MEAINPVEELLKAIGIVRGKEAEERLRLFIAGLVETATQKVINQVPWDAERLRFVLHDEIRYKDWKFIVDEREVHRTVPEVPESVTTVVTTDLRMRVEWMGIDTVTGKPEMQQSRWWPLSSHMCKTEVIQTAFLCVLKAEEHEIREAFRYKGKAPFHTHIDIDTLAHASGDVDVRTDTRLNAPTNQRRE